MGSLDATHDWGHGKYWTKRLGDWGTDFRTLARDYVERMRLMLQQEKLEDFVLATGETHPVREYVEKAFKHLGYDIK